MDKKCTHCGSTKLVKEKYNLADSNDMPYPIDIYVCEECRHIELFRNSNSLYARKKNK